MKKQGADQAFHDRRHQERQRAEAAKKQEMKKAERAAGEKQVPIDSLRAGSRPPLARSE
jgi:hypothetical protein